MRSLPVQEHNRHQLDHYRDIDRERIRPVDTPYVRRHFDEVRTAARLDSGRRVLEVGCGNGRFTRKLCELGYPVVANDLSPALLEALKQAGRPGNLKTLAGDVTELPALIEQPFDRAVGFFMLHHLYNLDDAFRSLAAVLEPGSRVAFSEPNGYNPLFYLQIFLTPSMSWKVEKGIRNMIPGVVFPAMARQGFVDLEVRRYGFFPPGLSNKPVFRRLESAFEKVQILRPACAFQVFSGRLGNAGC